MKKDTSWNEVAGWYDDLLGQADTYQEKVILPNLIRCMNIKKGETIADMACGNGFFSGHFLAAGAQVIGFDISPRLISSAKNKYGKKADFFVASADEPERLAESFVMAVKSVKSAESSPGRMADKAVCVLAIQNIENVKGLFESCRRILAPSGSLYIVMNHPAYRIPQGSSWGFDEVAGRQYRRVDRYLSEMKIPIVMNPGHTTGRSNNRNGENNGDGKNDRNRTGDRQVTTFSFHRPLQYYFKLLQASGFSVVRLEEWISHRHSQTGPRQKEEDRARGEFPLFLFIEARKIQA